MGDKRDKKDDKKIILKENEHENIPGKWQS